MDIFFSLSSLLVMPFWLLMIALPHWRWTRRVMQSPLVSAAPALLYLALALPRFGELFAAVTNPTLPGIAAVLGTPVGATLAWAHFLAFDLFVGRWAYLDSRERGVSAWIMAPVLFFTLMLGPIGFLSYLAVRAFTGSSRTIALEPSAVSRDRLRQKV
ncbi:MAG TPA: ABA4-like family protein [Roseiflexaceae bacterium]|nr:ABA4-like family protein [Roseiflexaceae bacterium]